MNSTSHELWTRFMLCWCLLGDTLVAFSYRLKRECRQFGEFFLTCCTGSCHFDNAWFSQWWKGWQNDDTTDSACIPLLLHWHIEYITPTVTLYELHGISNHRLFDCLLNNLFRLTSQKTSKIHIKLPFEGIHRLLMDSTHKGTEIRRVFLCQGIIMSKSAGVRPPPLI